MSADATRARVIAGYHAAFGEAPAYVARAPGRVNLIGEHTDYNDGFVLPCAIDRATWVAIGPADDDMIAAIALDYGDARDRFAAVGPVVPRPDAEWANHVRGMALEMRGGARRLAGARIAIGGDIPQGAGLSSSASLAVAVGAALDALSGRTSDATALALAAQRSENDFVGCACGIMDQLVSARGRAGHAALIDCRSLAVSHVAIPASHRVMVVHSGIRRGLVGSEYNLRREQCEAVAVHFGRAALRDLSLDELKAGAAALDPVALRRARHVITENARVLAAAEALPAGNWAQMSALMAQSHASMRDDFAITLPPVDALVALIAGELGERGGARMTGGGFGGCVVALVPADAVDALSEVVTARYASPSGAPPMILLCDPSDGAGLVQGR